MVVDKNSFIENLLAKFKINIENSHKSSIFGRGKTRFSSILIVPEQIM